MRRKRTFLRRLRLHCAEAPAQAPADGARLVELESKSCHRNVARSCAGGSARRRGGGGPRGEEDAAKGAGTSAHGGWERRATTRSCCSCSGGWGEPLAEGRRCHGSAAAPALGARHGSRTALSEAHGGGARLLDRALPEALAADAKSTSARLALRGEQAAAKARFVTWRRAWQVRVAGWSFKRRLLLRLADATDAHRAAGAPTRRRIPRGAGAPAAYLLIFQKETYATGESRRNQLIASG